MGKKNGGPRVLIFDIETAPLVAYTWGIWDQNVGLNQIKSDWHLLSWAAKWLDDPPSKIMYQDQRKAKDITDDKKLLEGIWDLLDEADIVITQNGKQFDVKKLNARFIMNDMPPPSTYKHLDTKQMAKKYFAFTSNKLEYMTDKVNTKYKKQDHGKYPGFALWLGCLAGDKDAWKEMEKYNKYDVLSLEELYHKMAAWDSSLNFSLYYDDEEHVCSCGHKEFRNKGYAYTSSGKYRRYQCLKCGRESRGKENLFSKEKRKSLHMGTTRS
jgi:hypothetical protein